MTGADPFIVTNLYLLLCAAGWAFGGLAVGYWFGRKHGQDAAIKAVNEYLSGVKVISLANLKTATESAEVIH